MDGVIAALRRCWRALFPVRVDRAELNRRAAVEDEMLAWARELRRAPEAAIGTLRVAEKVHAWATRLGTPEDRKTFGRHG